MTDNVVHPPLDCCGEDTCPYDYCALEADEMIAGDDDEAQGYWVEHCDCGRPDCVACTLEVRGNEVS